MWFKRKKKGTEEKIKVCRMLELLKTVLREKFDDKDIEIELLRTGWAVYVNGVKITLEEDLDVR